MRNRRLRPSSAQNCHRQSFCSRLPSCWGLLVIILAGVTAFNLFIYNYEYSKESRQPLKQLHAGAGEAEAGAAPYKNAFSDAADGGGGGGVVGRTGTSAKNGEEDEEQETSSSVDHRGQGPPPPPTPLGRDQPLVFRVRAPVTVDDPPDVGNGGNNVKNEMDSLFAWPEEGDEHTSTVRHFPCSLTEAGQYLGQQQEKAWSTSGPCVISCSAPPEGNAQTTEDLQSAQEKGEGVSPAEAFRQCSRALRACEFFQECTHVLLPSPPAGEDPRSTEFGFASLMHLPSTDRSWAAVEAAIAAVLTGVGPTGGGKGEPKWRGMSKALTLETRPRTYYVVSFGGSGSKMLGGWLSERGQRMVREVFHIHDPEPAETLFAKEARKGVRPGRAGRGQDFRGYDFPEGDFPRGGSAVQDIDSYRVVLIFKDPAEALVSRYFYNHCKNLRGADCGASEKAFPSLERYAEESGDRLHMEAFYDNYCNPAKASRSRNYPVVCVNYHKMWDNKEALVAALGLPAEEASKMPIRTETVRNDQTSARRKEPFTLAVRERLRVKHDSLSRKIFEAPAVAIV